MEIFNIHIFEFLLIASLALVVFGPERLPEVGRFIGRQVARFLAWQQQSPELKMINDVRGDFEREIASLRDDLVRTRSQLDITQKMNELRDELRPMLDLRIQPNPPAATPAATAMPGAGTGAEPAPAASSADGLAPAPAGSAPAPIRPNKIAHSQPASVLNPPGTIELPPAPAHRAGLHDAAQLDDAPLPAPAATPDAEHARLIQRLETMLADMQALVGELQERGLISADWQPPSQRSPEETVSR